MSECLKEDKKSYSTGIFLQDDVSYSQDWLDYRAIYDQASAGREFDFPIHLEIENIYACNLHYVHCAREYIGGDRVKKMDDALYRKLIDEAVEMGVRSLGFAIWGEVFLDKNIFDKISYAFEKGILDIRLHSNGILITGELAEKIVSSGLTWMSVSLDAASPETYAKVRGGDYERAVQGLENLIKAKAKLNRSNPKIRTSFVKCSINEHEEQLFIEKYKDVCDIVIQEFYDANGILPNYLSLSNPTYEPKKQCFENFYKAFVRHDGTVVPCCEDVQNRIVLGNVSKSSLREIYNSPVAKDLRRQHAESRVVNPTCRICMKL